MAKSPFIPRYESLPDTLPVFPLSGSLVFPGTELPLNVFEPRYLNMVEDAMAGSHLIGMVQPLPGQSKEPPALCQTGCAGRITSYQETDDGRILLVLSGVCRFDILEELPEEPSRNRGYRRVRPEWRRFVGDYDLSTPIDDRVGLMDKLKRYMEANSLQVEWSTLENLEDHRLIDLLAMNLPLDERDKQSLLESVDIPSRGNLLAGLLEMGSLVVESGSRH